MANADDAEPAPAPASLFEQLFEGHEELFGTSSGALSRGLFAPDLFEGHDLVFGTALTTPTTAEPPPTTAGPPPPTRAPSDSPSRTKEMQMAFHGFTADLKATQAADADPDATLGLVGEGADGVVEDDKGAIVGFRTPEEIAVMMRPIEVTVRLELEKQAATKAEYCTDRRVLNLPPTRARAPAEKDFHGDTALHLAISSRDEPRAVALVRAAAYHHLLPHHHPKARAHEGHTPFVPPPPPPPGSGGGEGGAPAAPPPHHHKAKHSNPPHEVRLPHRLLDAHNTHGETPLHLAAALQQPGCVRALLEARARRARRSRAAIASRASGDRLSNSVSKRVLNWLCLVR